MPSPSLWSSAPALSLPSLDSEIATDICVVGLGGSGLVCVLELLRLGVRVVGIDAGEIGGGAAGRNGGFLLAGLAPFHHDAVARFGRDRAVALYRLTLDELDRIADESPDTVERPGSLRIAESDEERDDCVRQLDAMSEDGLPAQWYEGDEGVGILVPGDGTVHPLARCHALAVRARDEGALLFERTRALDVAPGAVRTAAGVIRARHVIVAVDGALDLLLPELAGDVRTARLQMLATAPTPEARFARPVYARWGYDYWQQRPDGAIALGGARDAGGDAEWTHDVATTAVVQGALERRLREQMGISAPITHRWAASVGYTRDGVPLAREVRSGVWAIGGYSGTGNVVGALLGRGVARLVAGGDDRLLRHFL
ncbi:MAG: FAD-binding oxidoreductase [Gemmatimonadaceae bacterium]|nr:FAD-binding oxidoreductase [Gemmatimonadaceae bacterium]